MWRFLQIGWQVLWGIAEVLIVLVVLNTIKDNNTAQIIAVLGLIYATMRSVALGNAMGMASMAAATDFQFDELKRRIDALQAAGALEVEVERPDKTRWLNRQFIDSAIKGVVIGLIYLICLFQFFSRLAASSAG